jgi:hypothetical protein
MTLISFHENIYSIEYNNPVWISATLLGFDCLVKEQCSMKVANSMCLHGSCRCESGYLQFRRHTCLSRKYTFIMIFNFFNQRMHLFISVQFTLHMFRPRPGHHQGYTDKFTSLFTGPFGIITTVTLFKAIIYVGNHQYTHFLQVVSWNVLVYSTINCEYRALCRER